MDEFSTPQEYLYHHERQTPEVVYLRQPVDGKHRSYTWGQAIDQARRLVTALREIGVGSGQPVAILSRNCAEWVIADFALMIGGYVSVPIYATANEATIGHILEHSEARAIFVGKLDEAEAQSRAIPAEVARIAFPYPTMAADNRWDELLARHAPFAESPVPAAADVMTILYTSGSTGKPKGAVHSFHNFTYAGRNIGKLLGVTAAERVLSYLPLAHCTERAYVESSSLVHGGEVWFVESLDTFADNLRECAPTFFGSVPRLWKQLQLGVLEQAPQTRLDRLLPIPLLGRWLRRRIRHGLGFQNVRWFMSGSAPIAPALLEWWRSVGVPIAEGWGMTETLAHGTLLPYGEEIRQGSIGKAGTGTDIRIEAGELEIRTPSLMSGYFKDPELTAEVMTADGYLRTGDRGEIDADGYIRITGRTKDIFKTAKGKYVAPVPIESLIARNPFVEQVCLVGSGLRAPVALVQLNAVSRAEAREDLIASLERTRQSVNEQLESHERVERVILVSAEWTAENGLLTPTLKIRRHELETRYRALVERHYPKSVVFESG